MKIHSIAKFYSYDIHYRIFRFRIIWTRDVSMCTTGKHIICSVWIGRGEGGGDRVLLLIFLDGTPRTPKNTFILPFCTPLIFFPQFKHLLCGSFTTTLSGPSRCKSYVTRPWKFVRQTATFTHGVSGVTVDD